MGRTSMMAGRSLGSMYENGEVEDCRGARGGGGSFALSRHGDVNGGSSSHFMIKDEAMR